MSWQQIKIIFWMMSVIVISGCQKKYNVEQSECAKKKYYLLEGTVLENTVSVTKGKTDGMVIYLVGGIHGDEVAGWKAAERLKEISISSGTLYILSMANRYGVEHNQRKTREERDLNRNFPGDTDGCDTERVAAAIYQDIKEKKPDLVLDLHEALSEKEDRDFIGNSIICQSLDGDGDLVLELLEKSLHGELTSSGLELYGSPPQGSLNRVITEELEIPVITVETFREEALETRIRNHMEIMEYVLRYFEMR